MIERHRVKTRNSVWWPICASGSHNSQFCDAARCLSAARALQRTPGPAGLPSLRNARLLGSSAFRHDRRGKAAAIVKWLHKGGPLPRWRRVSAVISRDVRLFLSVREMPSKCGTNGWRTPSATRSDPAVPRQQRQQVRTASLQAVLQATPSNCAVKCRNTRGCDTIRNPRNSPLRAATAVSTSIT